MTQGGFTASLLAGLLVASLTFSGPALASKAPRIQGKVMVEGIVAAVRPDSRTFSIQIRDQSRRKRRGSEFLQILLQRATELQLTGRDDRDEVASDRRYSGARRQATIADIRVGDWIELVGFRLADGRILALRLQIKNRPTTYPGQAESIASGVVTARDANSVMILSSGISRAILITPTTEFSGQRTALGAVQSGDVVMVWGLVNADGSVVASRVETTLTAGITIRGRITAKSATGPLFLMLDNATAVNIAPDTQFISFGQLRSFLDLQVGRIVTVTGSPITIGGVLVAINARTITF